MTEPYSAVKKRAVIDDLSLCSSQGRLRNEPSLHDDMSVMYYFIHTANKTDLIAVSILSTICNAGNPVHYEGLINM